MIKVTFNKAGFSKLARHLRRISNTRKLMKDIGETLEKNTKLRFNQSVDPDGNIWTPRSEKYKAYLQRRGKLNNKVLVLSGRLQKSIEYVSDDKSVTVGTVVDYGEKHQEGEDGLPVRKFIGISEKDREEIDDIVEKHINK